MYYYLTALFYAHFLSGVKNEAKREAWPRIADQLNKFFEIQNTTCPNILWCLYFFCALFVLYLVQLHNKQDIYILAVLFLQPHCSLALSPSHHAFLTRQAQVLGLQWKLLLKQNYNNFCIMQSLGVCITEFGFISW